jgi:transposase
MIKTHPVSGCALSLIAGIAFCQKILVRRLAINNEHLCTVRKTVRVIARRYEEEGLESALYEKPRPGKPRSLDPSQNQRVIAMVCSLPPAGQARWSVRLIASEAVKRKLAPQVSRETIRILLQNHDLKPWREKNVMRGGSE